MPRTLREKRIPCDGLIYLSSYGEALGWNRGVGQSSSSPSCREIPKRCSRRCARSTSRSSPTDPVLHEKSPLFAEAESRGYLLAEGKRRDRAAEPTIARGSDSSTSPTRRCGAGGGRPTGAGPARGGGVVARRWGGTAGESTLQSGSGAAPQPLRWAPATRPSPKGKRPIGPISASPALPVGGRGDAAVRGDVLVGRHQQRLRDLGGADPLGLNTGLSGVPYWGTDVGGFFHPIPESGELYSRWFPLGAFSPIFRSHG